MVKNDGQILIIMVPHHWMTTATVRAVACDWINWAKVCSTHLACSFTNNAWIYQHIQRINGLTMTSWPSKNMLVTITILHRTMYSNFTSEMMSGSITQQRTKGEWRRKSTDGNPAHWLQPWPCALAGWWGHARLVRLTGDPMVTNNTNTQLLITCRAGGCPPSWVTR